jgi:hypothetical protein
LEVNPRLDAVVRAGARVYCSLACSAATEALESTGDVVVEESLESLESREQLPPSA